MMAPADDGVRLVDLPGDLAGTRAARGRARCPSCTAWRGAPRGTSPRRRTWSGRCGAASSSRCSRGRSPRSPARPATAAPSTSACGAASRTSSGCAAASRTRTCRQMTAAADRLAAVRLDGLDDAGLLAARPRAQGRARPRRGRLRRRLRALRPRRPPVRRRLQRRAAPGGPLRVHRPAHGDADAQPAAQRRPGAHRRLSARRGGGGGAARGRRVRRRVRRGRRPARQGPRCSRLAHTRSPRAAAARHAGAGTGRRRPRSGRRRPARPDAAARARRFVEAHPEAERERAEALLDLARASWRLRDDDNLYLDRLRRLLDEALGEAERRGLPVDDAWRPREVTLPSPLAPAPGLAAAADASDRPAADATAAGRRPRPGPADRRAAGRAGARGGPGPGGPHA